MWCFDVILGYYVTVSRESGAFDGISYSLRVSSASFFVSLLYLIHWYLVSFIIRSVAFCHVNIVAKWWWHYFHLYWILYSVYSIAWCFFLIYHHPLFLINIKEWDHSYYLENGMLSYLFPFCKELGINKMKSMFRKEWNCAYNWYVHECKKIK